MAIRGQDGSPFLARLQRHRTKLIALGVWLLLIALYYWYVRAYQVDWAEQLNYLRSGIYGPLLYIALQALRPLIFFPASVLTIAGGLLFGLTGGIIYSLIGTNLAGLLAYIIGRYFGHQLLDPRESGGFVERYAWRMRHHSFETVLILRLLLTPFDFVSYLAGLLQIDWRPYLLGTNLGSLPASLSLVLMGVAGDVDWQSGKFTINPWLVASSLLLMAVSIGGSRLLRRRDQKPRSI
jgi:uncharacterized membrane protein YdjX (TVP38/TMEM64 family)